MSNRHRRRAKKQIFWRILAIPVFILLSYAAVRIGIIGGTLLFDINMKGKMVENVDTENFKTTLNKSLPLMDAVYNSGNISVSFTGEIRNFIKNITGFDLGSPLTILNAQSPYFYVYYNNNYLPFLERSRMPKVAENETNNKLTEDDPPPSTEANPPAKEDTTRLPEPISSITYEEDIKEDLPEENTISHGKIALQNETKYRIDSAEIARLLKEPLKFKFDRKGPKVLIYHTHTTESYVRNLAELKKKNVPGWTQDARYNVVRVGNELAQHMKKNGIEVIHNATIHDYPNYNLSYVNSLSTMNKILKSYPSIKITFDVHRDGLSFNKDKLRVTQKVNGKDAAKIMFVLGTDERLDHPHWKENLSLALKLQEKLNEIAPGLTKPIYISRNRYNQHLRYGSLIVEIGGDGNTLEEAMESTKYLAKALKEVIKQQLSGNNK